MNYVSPVLCHQLDHGEGLEAFNAAVYRGLQGLATSAMFDSLVHSGDYQLAWHYFILLRQ